MKRFLSLFFYHLLLAGGVFGQKQDWALIDSLTQETRNEINRFVPTHYLIDSTAQASIVFSFVVDSTGEILSAHIRKSQNLKLDYSTTYSICRDIQQHINLKYSFNWVALRLSYGYPSPVDKRGRILINFPYKYTPK